MNEKKRKYGWCDSYTCSFILTSDHILGFKTVFLKEDFKKRISISHLLKEN